MLLWRPEETTHPPYVTLRNNRIPELLPYNERNFYGVPTPSKSMQIQLNLVPGLTKSIVYLFTVLTDEDLEEDAHYLASGK